MHRKGTTPTNDTHSALEDNGTNHTIIGPYTDDRYFHLTGNLNAGYSWQVEVWGFILYSSSPSSSTSWANVQSASGGSANFSYASVANGFTTPTSSLSYPPSTTAEGTLIRYNTLNRAYVGLTVSITGFLKAGDEIRHVGEWNSTPPYPTSLKVYFPEFGD